MLAPCSHYPGPMGSPGGQTNQELRGGHGYHARTCRGCRERKALMTRPVYEERDHAFGQSMLTLRTAMGMTQARLARLLGVSSRAIVGWEAGSSYPKASHLQHLIVLALQRQAFSPGHEEEEIRVL